MSLAYEYDVFISYKRYGEWTRWVNETFAATLHQHLAMELGREPRIFVDTRLESGTDWQKDIANKLAFTRVLVPLFSRMYFCSEWCLRELYAIRHVESHFGLRTNHSPGGLIVPACIHDGRKEDLPAHLHDCCDIQSHDFSEFAITCLQRTSATFERFETALKAWTVSSLKPAILRSEQNTLTKKIAEDIQKFRFPCPAPATPAGSPPFFA